MPNKTGRFHLYSDTSKHMTGSALYQIQGGKPKYALLKNGLKISPKKCQLFKTSLQYMGNENIY